MTLLDALLAAPPVLQLGLGLIVGVASAALTLNPIRFR